MTDQPTERLQLEVPRWKRARAAVAAAAPDVVGLVSYVVVLAGVHTLWGTGWTLIAGGLPLFAVYVLRSLQRPAAPPRGEQ